MIEKKAIINTLFLISFSVYGVGAYISAAMSPSLGFITSTTPFIAIAAFYVVDLLYRPSFGVRINAGYFLMVLFLVSSAAALFVALFKSLPDTNLGLTVTRSLLMLMPFQAFVIVQLYNDDTRSLARLAFASLTLLLLINMIGFFVLGLSNELHAIEGRINFPFLDGLYSGSCLLAILGLMLLHYFREVTRNPFLLAGWLAYFAVSMVLLFYINSRLTLLVFLLVAGLQVMNMMGKSKAIFWISLFTIPILLSTGMILFRILSLPFFASLLQRVDMIDIVTFNGRAFLWQDGLDWLLEDHRGLLFGNGYRGHYFLNLVSDVAELWNTEFEHHLHLHSSSLEILVGQGVVGYALFLVLFFRLFSQTRRDHQKKGSLAVFFPTVVFLLIILQIDAFVYMDSLGFLIFTCIFSFTAVEPAASASEPMITTSNDQGTV